jgi:ABC-type multidrug transport system fused ATPase/permease subunit
MTGIMNMQNNAIWKSFQVLPLSDRRRMPLVFLAQLLLSLLDLVGVAIIGVVGALAVNGIKSSAPGNRVSSILEMFYLDKLTLQQQVSILGIVAALVLIMKTFISALLVRKITYYLSRRSALISSELAHKVFSSDPEVIRRKTPQENLFALTTGVVTIAIGIVATTVSAFADIFLLLVLFGGLLLVDYKMALITFSIFGTTSLVLYRIMHKRAKQFGETNARVSIDSNQTILEALYSFREIFVRDQQGFYVKKISKQRMEIANASAGLANMPNLSKYAVEITMVIGAVFLSAIQFLTQDAVHAVAVLSIFLAASSRIAPAVLRIQQGAIQIRGHSGTVEQTLKLIDELKDVSLVEIDSVPNDFSHAGFIPHVRLEDVSFNYQGSDTQTLVEINLEVLEGETIAIVGPSGAGKSTLVDIILGILNPQKGLVSIAGLDSQSAIKRWPGAISYLPQDVFLTVGTIQSNIAFGFDEAYFNSEYFERAIRVAQLESILKSLPLGSLTTVSDRGENFSGGQRQRIGIARALYTNPKLIVLDEVTSALDSDTENAFTDALNEIKGKITVIMIAHRLSSVIQADRIYYMESGKIVASGTFEELKRSNVNFARQAETMGL